MLEWLVPFTVFWIASAMFLGGWPVELEGGKGLQHVLGLIVTMVLFLAIWGGLRALLGGIGPVLGRLVLPAALTVVTVPLQAWLGYRVFGIRLRFGSAGH